MKISVVVKPNSRKESVEELADGTLKVRVNAPPVEGKANEAATRLIAKFYGVPPSAVTLLSGARSKKKLFRVEGRG